MMQRLLSFLKVKQIGLYLVKLRCYYQGKYEIQFKCNEIQIIMNKNQQIKCEQEIRIIYGLMKNEKELSIMIKRIWVFEVRRKIIEKCQKWKQFELICE
ncbi:unnamed protein product [Paramecium sonneborni]|uniref:Uncharacterized protein n=1 Tax=Paramecium sonneborni TaxID=65129 RepID=A0A8S1QKE0_9CILI|nr:unnamed protein product [Paramecium sonneborni]